MVQVHGICAFHALAMKTKCCTRRQVGERIEGPKNNAMQGKGQKGKHTVSPVPTYTALHYVFPLSEAG
jgi:hypothetical protein